MQSAQWDMVDPRRVVNMTKITLNKTDVQTNNFLLGCKNKTANIIIIRIAGRLGGQNQVFWNMARK